MSRFASLGLLVCAACSSSLPAPLPARQPKADYRPVPYPPPAAFAEVVPPQPRPDALWIDGHWAWRGGRYVWQRGGWVIAPAGSRYAHWRIRYSQDGTLQLAEETWYDAKLQPMSKPKPLVPAFTPPNVLTPESQHGF